MLKSIFLGVLIRIIVVFVVLSIVAAIVTTHKTYILKYSVQKSHIEHMKLQLGISTAKLLLEKQNNVPAILKDIDVITMYIQLHNKKLSKETATLIAMYLLLYADYYDFPVDLSISIMLVESHFDRYAVSSVDAIGLMQIHHKVWLKPNRHSLSGIGVYSREELFDIGVNIKAGSYIIAHYLHNNNTDNAIRKYYGGTFNNKATVNYVQKVKAKIMHFQKFVSTQK